MTSSMQVFLMEFEVKLAVQMTTMCTAQCRAKFTETHTFIWPVSGLHKDLQFAPPWRPMTIKRFDPHPNKRKPCCSY